MAGWIGPTVAISLLLIATCVVILTVVMVRVAKEAQSGAEESRKAIGELRERLDPVLDSITALTESGSETFEMARYEVKELATTSRMVRSEVEHAVRTARRRLADFDALVEVMQEEVEETALDMAVALQTVRASRGIVGRVGRLLARRHEDDE